MNNEFLDQYQEHMEMIGQGLTNLANRIGNIEVAMSKMPEPGADMIKYKPEGYEDYLNVRQLFDDLYVRLNMLEDRIKALE
ncbi:hypothetical protein SSZBM1_216 [Synechococcus phage S-SZBM1]|uniref:Uncharacterized protein n=1 Tax=Synechococcus phage S-SZBM1 TaxID=2926475 RepID=A0AC61TSY3_9CAUD|nr:hypothetical protein PP650_gp060 [Synechococcus phage S-SZBM1]UNH61333.1 hypothetical protein SSZBM1_216 [Synechococcus phage S-SZBM1]